MPSLNILSQIKKDGLKVSGISSDTRSIKKNNIFFAIPGSNVDGIKFVDVAIKKGASAVVISSSQKKILKRKIPIYKVKDIRKSLSESAFAFYKNNIKNKIAITGTNGKTSVLFFLQYLLSSLQKKTTTIGTLGTTLSNKSRSNLTTPDPIFTAKEMQRMSKKKIDYFIIEASSHGLHQKRFYPLKFDLCILTNISHDHLDYHRTLSHYISCKVGLFKSHLSNDGKSLISSETYFFERIKKELRNNKIKHIVFGGKNKKYRINKIFVDNKNVKANVTINSKSYQFKFKDFPIFQIKNFLLATIGLHLLGFNPKKISSFSLKCPHVPGRMELAGRKQNGARVYVDFAHTPDALKNILIEGKLICSGRLIVLFGCGGNRDKKKRPIMGKIAEKYADLAIVTDDNPRFENPIKIRKEIIRESTHLLDYGNRWNAIKRSIQLLNSADVLIIAGKGHEKYQIIKNKSLPFDDVKTADRFLKRK